MGKDKHSGAGKILWLSSIKISSFPGALSLRSRSEVIGLLHGAFSCRALPQQQSSIPCPCTETFPGTRHARTMRSSETPNLSHCYPILCHCFLHSPLIFRGVSDYNIELGRLYQLMALLKNPGVRISPLYSWENQDSEGVKLPSQGHWTWKW